MYSPINDSKKSPTAVHRRKTIYSHQSSRERRAEAARQPGEEVEIAARHQRERNGLIDKHREEMSRMAQRHHRAEYGHTRGGSNGLPVKVRKEQEAERKAATDSHATAMNALRKKHSAEVQEHIGQPRGTWGRGNR